jgi:hypothetical protein
MNLSILILTLISILNGLFPFSLGTSGILSIKANILTDAPTA